MYLSVQVSSFVFTTDGQKKKNQNILFSYSSHEAKQRCQLHIFSSVSSLLPWIFRAMAANCFRTSQARETSQEDVGPIGEVVGISSTNTNISYWRDLWWCVFDCICNKVLFVCCIQKPSKIPFLQTSCNYQPFRLLYSTRRDVLLYSRNEPRSRPFWSTLCSLAFSACFMLRSERKLSCNDPDGLSLSRAKGESDESVWKNYSKVMIMFDDLIRWNSETTFKQKT